MSTTGGSAWKEIDNTMDDGYSIALGSVYQGGCWDVVDNINNGNSVPAVFKSTDNGTSWQRTQLSSTTGDIRILTVHPTNKNTMYAGGLTRDASKLDMPALFKTTNGGSTWNPVTFSASGSCAINAILIDPANTNRMYLATTQGVYTSTNGGTNWQSPPTSASIVCLVADPKIANKVYAGGGSGIYITTNGGTSWTQANTGLTNKNIQCLEVDAVNSVLYAGTYGSGVFRASIATGVEEEPNFAEKPVQFVLLQNFPNPFNASTLISYCLNRSAAVRLSVVDLRGRTVKILVDAYETNGNKQAVWDGKDGSGKEVPSGIYLCRLATADRFEIRKMVYQK